jgi:catechol 2,3-dioxygenase
MQPISVENAVSEQLVPAGTRLGPVHIGVRDRDAALEIWRHVVGLTPIGDSESEIRLGADGEVLIVLHVDAERPAMSGTAGLYHVAIHVPERRDLAAFLARAIHARVPVSPTDHLVSEAVYLWDHDKNGIEITFETPWRGTLALNEEGGYAVTAEGKPHSGREPIDVHELLGELGETAPAETMPAGTRIGHIHVHVGDLDRAMRFYRDTLGFGGQLLSHEFGMGDVTVGYMPHIIAFNIWHGMDVSQPPAGTAGLRHFSIRLPGAGAVGEMRDRLQDAEAEVEVIADGFAAADPWGNRFDVTAE